MGNSDGPRWQGGNPKRICCFTRKHSLPGMGDCLPERRSRHETFFSFLVFTDGAIDLFLVGSSVLPRGREIGGRIDG